jgi:dTDP-4-amino-4,6-dideoxygalactose transaminase
LTPPDAKALRAVGGVMAAVAVGPAVAGNVLGVWGANWPQHRAFGSARAALAALLRSRGVRRAWLPAYVCPAVAEGVAAAGATPCFYRVSQRLEVDLANVRRDARSGDAIVGVAYFGRAYEAVFTDLRQRRDDLVWIDDRAQALDGSAAVGSDAAIYSPRKLVGVADGGLLFSSAAVAEPALAARDHWAPEDARALDPAGAAPETWYGLFQAREASVSAAPNAMSRRSWTALEGMAAKPLADARRRNWRWLAERLGAYALWRDLEPSFTPLAFPIVVPDAARAVTALAAERVWAPRHWPTLPSPASDFAEAHALSRRMVSLPCDQRYGEADMDRVADAVLRLLTPQAR